MGKNSAGATHLINKYIARDTAQVRGGRTATFAPGERVVVRPMEGVSNRYAGRLGEVVEVAEVDGEPVYHVLLDQHAVMLDYYGIEGEAGRPVAFFAAELRRTLVPKPSA